MDLDRALKAYQAEWWKREAENTLRDAKIPILCKLERLTALLDVLCTIYPLFGAEIPGLN